MTILCCLAGSEGRVESVCVGGDSDGAPHTVRAIHQTQLTTHSLDIECTRPEGIGTEFFHFPNLPGGRSIVPLICCLLTENVFLP